MAKWDNLTKKGQKNLLSISIKCADIGEYRVIFVLRTKKAANAGLHPLTLINISFTPAICAACVQLGCLCLMNKLSSLYANRESPEIIIFCSIFITRGLHSCYLLKACYLTSVSFNICITF